MSSLQRASESAPLLRHWGFWAAVLVGAGVRMVGLGRQVLVADEVHAFHGALATPLPAALATYRMQAHCPPFNAWLRAGIELGWQPSELALRLPVLLTGLAVLLVVPLWLERRLGTRVAATATWLLALSPLLVYYSRFMRPYMPAVLTSAVAAGAFLDWWRQGRAASGAVYAAAASLSIYLHLLSAPLVLSPWLFLGAEAMRSRGRRWPGWRRCLLLGGGLAALLAVWVVPAASSLRRLAPTKSQELALDARTWREGGMLLAGVGWGWLAVVLALAALRGVAVLRRRDPAFARYLLILIAAQLSGVLALSPAFLHSPPIFARYLLVALVPLLALAAAGLSDPLPALAGPARTLAIGLTLAAAVASGPLARAELYTSPFGLRPALLDFAAAEPRAPAPPTPAIYGRLAGPPDGDVIEVPARGLSRFVNTLATYQRVHRRGARLSPGDQRLLDPRLGVESFVASEPEAFLASGAAFLVVHRDWVRELGPGLGAGGSLPPDQRARAERELAGMARQARGLVRRLTGAWGRPDLAEGDLAIWDLERVRRAPAGRP